MVRSRRRDAQLARAVGGTIDYVCVNFTLRSHLTYDLKTNTLEQSYVDVYGLTTAVFVFVIASYIDIVYGYFCVVHSSAINPHLCQNT